MMNATTSGSRPVSMVQLSGMADPDWRVGLRASSRERR